MSMTLECVIDTAVNAANPILRMVRGKKKGVCSQNDCLLRNC